MSSLQATEGPRCGPCARCAIRKVGISDNQGRRGVARGGAAEAQEIAANVQVADVVLIDDLAAIVERQHFEGQAIKVAIRCQEHARAAIQGRLEHVPHQHP